MSAIDALIKLRADLQALSRAVKGETAKRIARQSIRAEALRLDQSWFSEVRPAIEGGVLSHDVLDQQARRPWIRQRLLHRRAKARDLGLRAWPLSAAGHWLGAPRAGRSARDRDRRNKHRDRSVACRCGLLPGERLHRGRTRGDTPDDGPLNGVRVHAEGAFSRHSLTQRTEIAICLLPARWRLRDCPPLPKL